MIVERITVPVTARSALFVPADRPDRYERAATLGADLVVVDLEDAVAAPAKAEARLAVRAWCEGTCSGSGARPVVRVNAASTPDLELDLAAVADVVDVVMLPKCESARDVARVRELAGRDVGVLALVETATGVLEAARIARADGVVRLALGNVDLAAELDVDPDDHEALLQARSLLVLASAAAGLPGPFDGVTTDVRDPAEAGRAAARARRLGMTAKLCIHPAQVEPVHAALAPDAAAVEWARRVVAADTGGVVVVDGRMVDAPVIARAHRLLRSGHVEEAGPHD